MVKGQDIWSSPSSSSYAVSQREATVRPQHEAQRVRREATVVKTQLYQPQACPGAQKPLGTGERSFDTGEERAAAPRLSFNSTRLRARHRWQKMRLSILQREGKGERVRRGEDWYGWGRWGRERRVDREEPPLGGSGEGRASAWGQRGGRAGEGMCGRQEGEEGGMHCTRSTDNRPIGIVRHSKAPASEECDSSPALLCEARTVASATGANAATRDDYLGYVLCYGSFHAQWGLERRCRMGANSEHDGTIRRVIDRTQTFGTLVTENPPLHVTYDVALTMAQTYELNVKSISGIDLKYRNKNLYVAIDIDSKRVHTTHPEKDSVAMWNDTSTLFCKITG
ncbi:hypothetical protein C8J57DRAFT_1210278 [Mycena rebaudengoi]|nr:hypothetical protein C8J57DRAFT_1210278 [Mycena rebaudengoi]